MGRREGEREGRQSGRREAPLFQFCQEGSEGLWSHISLVGLQIKTQEATGVQTQDADVLSASLFFFPKEN